MPASRTPEGLPSRCPVCGAEIDIDYSATGGDAPCPVCGHLLIESSQRAEKVLCKIASVVGVPIEELRSGPLTKLREIDSLIFLELIMELEEEYDISVPNEEAEKIETVNDAMALILRRILRDAHER